MSSVTPARRVAYAVVRRVFEEGAYADRALHGEARGLDRRDRAFATALAFGTVQRKATLDFVIEALARPVAQLDPGVVAALRLGLFQLLFLDGVGRHAAVGESVELAKVGSNGGHKLVNAVLRRATREPVDLPGDDTPQGAALVHSYPAWLVELWWERFGPQETLALLRAGNAPAELALRVNTLVTDPETLAAALPVETRPAEDVPEGLVVAGPFDAHGHPLFAEGAYTPQSRASMRVARALDPRPGERVLDLCAAPGGKTTHIAALLQGTGEVVAVERHPGRARALQGTVDRLRASRVRVEVGDGTLPRGDGPFDRVLVDPPCSGLGTLQGHPDVRWRATPESVEVLAEQQARLLAAAAAAVRPGGRVVYATCTLSPRENEEVIATSRLAVRDVQLLLPHREGTEGFLIATLSG